MDLQDKITAPLDLATLDESHAEAQSPEQYAINTIGGRVLQTTNMLIKKSEQAIKNALAKPNMPRTIQAANWPAYEKTHNSPYQPTELNGGTEPAHTENPPAQAEGFTTQDIEARLLPNRPQPSPPRQDKRTTSNSQNQYTPTGGREKTSTHAASSCSKSGAQNGADSLQIYERPSLATCQGETLTSGLQSHGPGLALAEKSGAGSQTFQAAGQAAEGGTSVASASAEPAAIAYQATEKAVTKVKETIENIAARAQSGKQTLGALAALFFIPLLILAGIAGALRSSGFASNVNLSADVLALMPQISAACQAHGIPEYAPLVAAVMMQESGGNVELVHGDVMQCAEFLGYPAGTPVFVEESINHGVGVLAHKLSRAGSTGPTDIPRISLALQANNYGDGYFDWAASHGGGGMGAASAIANGAFAYPSEGHRWTTYPGHEGIDIPLDVGTPVYTCAAGTVTYAQAGWQSRYANMSSVVVASGTMVQQGQLIGYVGSTGNSSGPHLHLALYYNGNPSSGGAIYAEQAWPQYSR